MSNKPRPNDGPGSNGLRGGIREYSYKTASGPWLDKVGGAQQFKRGFTTSEYETEAQYMQRTGVKAQSRYYGSEIVDPGQTQKLNPFEYTNTYKDPQEVWTTNTRIMGQSISYRDIKKEAETNLKYHQPEDKLQNYRKTWTIEQDDKFRELRFTTESLHAFKNSYSGTNNEKFLAPCVRYLPGTPKAYEILRDRMIEKFGGFAFLSIRDVFNYKEFKEVSSEYFINKIHELDIDLKLYEINHIINYLSSNDKINLDTFFNVLIGKVSNFNENKIIHLFNSIKNNTVGSNPSSPSHKSPASSPTNNKEKNYLNKTILINSLNSSSLTPTIYAFFEKYITIYTEQINIINNNNEYENDNDNEQISLYNFILFFKDICSAIPDKFEDFINSLWEL